jgi:hypothetical protein
MYPGDARAKVPKTLFADPRVTSFWDPHELSGAWFGRLRIGGLEGVVWDAFYMFGGSARWDRLPAEVLAAGGPVMAGVGTLDAKLTPLLR